MSDSLSDQAKELIDIMDIVNGNNALTPQQKRGLRAVVCTNDTFLLNRVKTAELPLEIPQLFQDYFEITGRNIFTHFRYTFECKLPPKPPSMKGESEIKAMHTTEHATYKQAVAFLEENISMVELGTHHYKIVCDGQSVTADSWHVLTRNATDITFQVIVSKPKALSAFGYKEALELISGTSQCAVETKWEPPQAELDPQTQVACAAGLTPHLRTEEDILRQAGYEICVRLRVGPGVKERMQESSKRNLIGSVIYNAALCAGGLVVTEEAPATDGRASGLIDYGVQLDGFNITVIEGKKQDSLEGNEGQVLASMYTTRQTFVREAMCENPPPAGMSSSTRKRKRQSLDLAARGQALKEVPSVGVLSNGFSYKFFAFDHQKDVLKKSEVHTISLSKGMSATEAAAAIRPVFTIVLGLFKSQTQSFKGFAAANGNWLVKR